MAPAFAMPSVAAAVVAALPVLAWWRTPARLAMLADLVTTPTRPSQYARWRFRHSSWESPPGWGRSPPGRSSPSPLPSPHTPGSCTNSPRLFRLG
ncbi:MAG: hypothetical protein SF028_04885 [Candidatus Sumerlaeia bacterium]|nr:hypothetical protein [Candidatus Sumerlaeia bacterium]